MPRKILFWLPAIILTLTAIYLLLAQEATFLAFLLIILAAIIGWFTSQINRE
jgi:hypothetical protein